MTVIFRTTARTVIPVIITTSVVLFLQGHNLPGGGFIGGTLAATAFALVYLAYGTAFLREELLEVSGPDGEGNGPSAGAIVPGRSPGQRRAARAFRGLFALGLLLAVASGLIPVVLGEPFMSQSVVVIHDVPLYHELEFASALAFDLGVYLVVVGAVMTVLSEVGAE